MRKVRWKGGRPSTDRKWLERRERELVATLTALKTEAAEVAVTKRVLSQIPDDWPLDDEDQQQPTT